MLTIKCRRGGRPRRDVTRPARAPAAAPTNNTVTKKERKREWRNETETMSTPQSSPEPWNDISFFGNHTFLLIDAFDLYVPTNQDLVAIKIELVKSTWQAIRVLAAADTTVVCVLAVTARHSTALHTHTCHAPASARPYTHPNPSVPRL